MKQKVIIGFSLVLLLLALYLIAHDLFRHSPSFVTTSSYDDEERLLKQFDTTMLGYERIRLFDTGLRDLSGIAVGDDQKIFVSGDRLVAFFDSTGNRLGVFTVDSASTCIALNDDDIYIGLVSHIAHFTESGELKEIWKPYSADSYITSIAADDESVYAADAYNKRILRYTLAGDLVQEFGRKDSATAAPGFVIPSFYFDVVIGGYNDLWVADPGRLSVENYTVSGYLRSAWGKASFEDNGFTGCCNPAHMALLQDGSFVTYEKGIDKVKVFGPGGRFRCMVAGAGSFRGNKDFQLGNNNLVKDIAVNSGGDIYILDAYNQVNVFRKIMYK
jgi:hypothetical protein